MPAFGRMYAPDARDHNYPLRALLAPQRSTRTHRYWNQSGWWGDQGSTPQCVAYSLVAWLEDGPVTQRGTAPVIAPAVLYNEAQAVDEWPGPPPAYDGTSVRAGAKALQASGFISSYHWAESLDDIVQCLLEIGPVVMGTDWTESMMETDPAGFLHVEGDVVGGHAWKVDGVNTKARFVRAKNSWGREWGLRGNFYLSFDDLDLLLHDEGEAMLAVEVRK